MSMDRRYFLGILGLASAAPLMPKAATPGTPETDEQRFYRLARNGPVTNQAFHFKHTVNLLPGMVVTGCVFKSSAKVCFEVHNHHYQPPVKFMYNFVNTDGPESIAIKCGPTKWPDPLRDR